jgi:hypothetical protein
MNCVSHNFTSSYIFLVLGHSFRRFVRESSAMLLHYAPLFLLLCSTAALAGEDAKPNTLSATERSEGWILLFDGETTFGWKAESKANWEVKDGAIRVSEGEPGLLRTTTQFADYELKVDFRAPAKTNSGVFLRTAPVLDKNGVTTQCYELNVAPPDNPFPTGSFVGRQKAKAVKESEDWRTFHVVAEGAKITVTLDGDEVLAYTDPQPLGRGFIGLQLNTGAVEFRNVKLKPLSLASLFNGKDLTAWKTYPNMASKFTVTDKGELNVKNGRGQLESVGQYADFVLQLECISHAEGLNSGLFFRTIPGSAMDGYECQIHNGFKDGDRTKPVDHGTGGIFKRQEARRVVANDKEWFSLTLAAEGPHVAAWVNGLQVSDWVDTRKADPNPRKGVRLEKGTLMIQGHDPTTDLSFRNLQAAELPKRRP